MPPGRKFYVATAAALFATMAAAADHVAERAPADAAGASPPGRDGTLELTWDSGKASWLIAWRSGAGTRVGNDFDVATLKTYPHVRTIRVYSSPAWPNGTWDGFYIGVYALAGGVPASMMWPPGGRGRYVKGTTSSYGWQIFAVDWTLPSGVRKFVPAVEQYYDFPNCDPHVVDDNATFRKHSWAYYQGNWHPLTNKTGYYNLMLRVVVDDEHNPGVAPATVGRVKALYY